MSLLEICHYLQNTELAATFRQANLFFPLVEGTHILALSISVGLILMLDLRLLRWAFAGQPVSRVTHQVMPWAIPGFVVMFITGIVLFLAQAENVYTNGYFRAKVLMLFLLGVNAAVFQYVFYPQLDKWDMSENVPMGAKVVALASLVFWIAVIAFGRLMAYEL